MTTKRFAAWVIPIVMVVVAVAHGFRVAEFSESPWVGAGFGMFAQIDGPQRVTEIRLVDGVVRIVPSLSAEELERLSNFPSQRSLEAFADRHDQIAEVSILKPVLSDDLKITWEKIASYDET